MFIPASLVGFRSTQSETDYLINNLVLSPQDFSEIACLNGRMAGIVTDCDTCQYVFNSCIRKSLVSMLISAQKTTEAELGYALTPRYHIEEVEWNGSGRYTLRHAGISAVGVIDVMTFPLGWEEMDATIDSVTSNPSNCTMTVTFSVFAAGTYYLNLWDAGIVLVSQGIAVPAGGTVVAVINIGPVDETFAGVGIYIEEATALDAAITYATIADYEPAAPACVGAWSIASMTVTQGEQERLYPISPFLIPEVTVQDSGLGMCVAVVPTSLVSNPNKLDFWDDQGISVDTQRWPGYPRRVGDNWEIPLGSRCPAPDCNTPISAFHCEYTVLETPIMSCAPNTTYTPVPVYMGTSQIIPQYRPMEIDGEIMRWFIPISALLDPAFIDENADLSQGEFWKLIQKIDFACVAEVAHPTRIVYKRDCEDTILSEYDSDTEPRFLYNVINAARGIIEIIDHSPLPDCCKSVDKIAVYYKTDPANLGFTVDLGGMMQGMAHYVASLLPLNSCGCATAKQTDSFIETAQKAYTDIRINPVTGETFMPMKFGNLYGQLVYTETLGRMPKFVRGYTL